MIKYVVIVAIPAAILFALLQADVLQIIRERGTSLSIVANGSRFVVAGDEFETTVILDASEPVNAIESKIYFPKDVLEIVSVSVERSVIDIWVREPWVSQEGGEIELVGGVVRGYTGKGELVTVRFRAKKPGDANLQFTEARVLAHDGKGTDVLKHRNHSIYLIRNADKPSPDLNGDLTVNTRDLAILLYYIATSENSRYDLNGDGKVGMRDAGLLLSLVF